MIRVVLGLAVMALSIGGALWAFRYGTTDRRPPAKGLGDVEQDWVATVEALGEETA